MLKAPAYQKRRVVLLDANDRNSAANTITENARFRASVRFLVLSAQAKIPRVAVAWSAGRDDGGPLWPAEHRLVRAPRWALHDLRVGGIHDQRQRRETVGDEVDP